MGSRSKRDCKEKVEVIAKYDAFYSGGGVQITQDGQFMLCCKDDCLKVVDVASGKIEATLAEKKDDRLTSFILADDDKTLVIASKSGIIEQWDFQERKKIKGWKSASTGPVSCMAFDSTSTLLAIGGTDSTVKVWDIIGKYYTHNFKGAQGVFSIVCFHKSDSGLNVFGAADDYKIRAWSLDSRKCIATLEGHYSTVTSLQFCVNNTMISGGRDNVVLLWSLVDFTCLKTIPIYEGIESVILIPEGRILPELHVEKGSHAFITAGSTGALKVWDSSTGRCIHSREDVTDSSAQEEEGTRQRITTQAFYNKALDAVSIVTFEHNILIYKLEDFSLVKQFVGYNDEVLDIKFMGEKEEYLAVATNSPLIRIYEISTFSCQLLEEHKDLVVSLDVFPKDRNMLISGSKDNSIFVWRMDSNTGKVQCIYMAYGHTHNISAVACCKNEPNFFLSASYDRTLKLWDIPTKKRLISLRIRLSVRCTVKAHEKTINSIAVSINDKLVATGSQDHSAKIWNASDLSFVGIMNGHKKGVMCVEFSPIDKVLATASKDGTVRLWSLADCSSLMSLDGHSCPVQKVMFLSKGIQILSSSCDGAIKLWNIKKSDCIQTETEHSSEVWALTASQNEDFIVSGGADSSIIIWKDVTEEKRAEEIEKHNNHILQEQQLLNLMREKKWVDAFLIAVQLEQPLRTYKIIKEILRDGDNRILHDAVSKMKDDQIQNLLKYASEWNTITKFKRLAFIILSAITAIKTPEELLSMPELKSNLAALLSYADRNFRGIVRAQLSAAFSNFLMRNAKIVAEENEETLTHHAIQNSKKRKAEEEEEEENSGNASKNAKCSA